MKRVFLYLIGWYKRWLSPLQRVPHCRFLPTCSEYAAEAIELHGPLRGLFMATGWDPLESTCRHASLSIL